MVPTPIKPHNRPALRSQGVGRRARRRVLALLFLLSVVTYLDRVAISAAAPAMMKDLGISPLQMGMVFSAFVLG